MTTNNAAEWYETEYIHACRSLAQARADLAQAHIELRQIKKLWLNPAGATQIRADLKDLQRRLEEAMSGRSYWFKKCLSLEAELDAAKERLATLDAAEKALGQMREHAEHLSGQLQIAETGERAARKMLARAIVAEADAELAGHAALQAERRLRQAAEQKRDWWCKEMQESEERHTQTRVLLQAAEKRTKYAEALAQLVTKKAADLLERLANHTASYADSFADPNSSWTLLRRAEIKAARALAAQIREVLDEH